MWIVTEDGFFSCVNGNVFPMGLEAEPEEFDLDISEYLLVRSRDSDSMDRLKRRLLDHSLLSDGPVEGWPWEGLWTGKVWSNVGSDYEHRMLMPRDLFGKYLNLCASNLQYRNFKTRVVYEWSERLGDDIARDRSNALLDTWYAFKTAWPTDEVMADKGGLR